MGSPMLESKEGFKETKLGWIPEDWEVKEVGDKIEISKKRFNPQIGVYSIKCVELENINKETGSINGYFNSNNQKSIKAVFNDGDVLFGKLRPNLRKYWFAKFDGVCSTEIWVLKRKSNSINKKFLLYFVQQEKFYQISNVTSGSKMPRANWSYIQNFPMLFPPLPEQKAIATCLSTWDDAITKLNKLIKAKQQLKKALMQQLLSGKKRLPGFDGEWSTWSYEELFKKVSRPVDWDDEDTYELISVRRRSGGLFHRDSLKGHEILTKKLYTAKKGDFLMSKMQILHGASGLVSNEFDSMKISGSYIAVVPKNDTILNMEYMEWYSQTPKFYHQTYRSSYGVHIEKMTFNYKLFKKEEMVLPSIDEQTAIAQVLNTADQEIKLLTNQRNQLQLQKKGLMQQLLTGRKRLKI